MAISLSKNRSRVYLTAHWPLFFALLFSLAIALFVPSWAAEFHDFYVAGGLLRQGISPYQYSRYYNPIWVALFFAPLSLLPEVLAWRLFAGLTILVTLWSLWRFKPGTKTWLIYFLSPFPYLLMINGNLEGWVLLGATLPPPIGIWLILAKPQMSIGLVLFWVVGFLKNRQWRLLGLTLVPAGLLFVVSWLLGLKDGNFAQLQSWNSSLWPFGIVFGLAFLFLGRTKETALASGPFLSPYVGFTSWLAVLPAVLSRKRLLILFLAVLWIRIVIWIGQITWINLTYFSH